MTKRNNILLAKLEDIVRNGEYTNSTDKNKIPTISNVIIAKMVGMSPATLWISKVKQTQFAEKTSALVTDDKFLDEPQEK